MKLTDIRGEAALDALADLIDPVASICSDPRIKAAIYGSKMSAIKIMLKDHKKSVITIMAILDGVPVEEFEVNLLTLPVKLLEILNDPEVVGLFTSAEQTVGAKPSGSASGSAEAGK